MKTNPPRQLSLLAKFSLVALVITAAIAVLLAWGLQQRLENDVLWQAAENAAGQVATVISPNLKPDDLKDPLSPARFEEIDALIRQNIPRQHIVRIKIWNWNGLVIYCDEKNLVGRRFPIHNLTPFTSPSCTTSFRPRGCGP